MPAVVLRGSVQRVSGFDGKSVPGPTPDQSGGEPLASLGAARGNDSAATAGSHAGAESVPAGTLQAAGLECTFHLDASFADLCVPGWEPRRAPQTGSGRLGTRGEL